MIIRINYKGSSDWSTFVQGIKSSILKHGVVVIENLAYDPNNDLLLRLAMSLGKLSLEDVIVPENLNSYVHHIEAKETPLEDSHGFKILSTTDLEFACHTDDYFSEHPSDVILFQCVHQAEHGGDSIIAFLSDVLTKLDTSTIADLKRSSFPSHFGLVAILTDEGGELFIRYNRIEVERSCQRIQVSLSQDQLAALDKLDEAIESSKHYLKLMPNECIVINNKKVLHGRTAFSQASNRLLRRVKLYL